MRHESLDTCDQMSIYILYIYMHKYMYIYMYICICIIYIYSSGHMCQVTHVSLYT